MKSTSLTYFSRYSITESKSLGGVSHLETPKGKAFED
jgi:hypothetical protein